MCFYEFEIAAAHRYKPNSLGESKVICNSYTSFFKSFQRTRQQRIVVKNCLSYTADYFWDLQASDGK